MNKSLFFVYVVTVFVSAASAQNPDYLEQRFKQFDRDSDGKLTPEELPRLQLFRILDRDGDGVVTREEAQVLRRASSADGTSTAAMAVQRDVAYGDHNAQRLDIYAPQKPVKDAPVMVYVHGGGWRRGDKSAVGRKATHFTASGWIFVSVNYRLLPDGMHPRNVEDVAAALAWVHEHIGEHGGDAEVMFVMGHSAGCHLASLVATDGRHLEKAGKSLSILKGVIGLDTQTYDIPKLIQGPSGLTIYASVFGEKVALQRDASPIHHVAKGNNTPPFLICYSSGMTARINPRRADQAKAFAAALKAAGVAAEVVDASDRNHGQINQWFGDPKDEKVTGKAMSFIDGLRRAEN